MSHVMLCVTDVGMYGQTSNGHADYSERYGTRCATGVIQRKRYDKVFTDEEDDDDDEGNDAEHGRRTLRRRNRRPVASDSDTERQEKMLRTPSKSASLADLASSSSTLRYSHKSEGESTDNETTSNASNATSQSDSGSDTEAYSEGSAPMKSGRMTRSASGGKPVVTNGHIKNGYDDGAKYRTRNQGRRTVHYQEADSDLDCDGRDARRTVERRRTEVGSRARLCRS